MRIIAGIARGRRLTAPTGKNTRPTLDRVRENLFNILAPRVGDAAFLDLFAGTGANGLEAISRGAQRAVLVESDLSALEVLRRNIAACGFDRQAELLRLVLPEGLGRLCGPFQLIFADPPYSFQDYCGLFDALARHELLADGGWIVVETARKTMLPDTLGKWGRFRRVEYGDTALSFYT